MSKIIRTLLIFVLIVKYDCEAARLRNMFVYEKDISEHCLRRVVPSVFLGRQAVDANSQVLYFSKVDLPYSCFISVRAESGSNIILVVQLSSGEDLKATCDKDPNQLLVYELGETFGGYWGPQELIKKSQNMTLLTSKSNLYTIKHTKKTEPVSAPETDVTVSDELQYCGTKKKMSSELITETQDFITIDVPLVNISGQLVPGEESQETFFEEEHFDMIYNVRPSPQGVYITTEVPLVQFSMEDNSGWGYQETRNPFGSSWNKFTSKKKLKQNKGRMNIPIKLKLKSPISRWLPLYNNTTTLSTDISGEYSDLSHDEMVERKTPLRFENDADIISIEELMSAYNRSGSLTTISEEELEREVSQLLDKLSALDHNQSAYMYNPNSEKNTEIIEFTAQSVLTKVITSTTNSSFTPTSIPHYSNKENQFKTRATDLLDSKAHITYSTSSPLSSIRLTTSHDNLEGFRDKILRTVTHSTMISRSLESTTTETGKELNNVQHVEQTVRPSTHTMVSEYALTSTSKRNRTQLEKKTVTTKGQSIVKPTTVIRHQRRNNSTLTTTGSLGVVDHESWENLVRAVPVMAVRLNETMPQKIEAELENNNKKSIAIRQKTKFPQDFYQSITSKQGAKKKRKKRFIQRIMIENGMPHNLTTKEEKSTTTTSSIQISDIQHFAELVELVDDDIHDRAALRYLNQYVARPMFNLCQYEQPKPRYVHLFNSSRLVISIGNFTLRRMQLVITPAKSLLVGKSRCEQSHLECQVNGNRVCIDAMSACDGVANCGETNIYDEDRLMCGGYKGLRHNVYLAAVTFLAVLLTLIYMVHYWLGRCVPKVSEAFFVYTEGDENVLFLDSIMRSPNDVGPVTGKSFEAFEADTFFTTVSTEESKIYSCIKKCLPCFFKKTQINNYSEQWDNLQSPPSNFSFPELEIHRMMNEQFKDACVQTGESLEMKHIKLLDKTTNEGKAAPSEKLLAKSTSPVSSIEIKRAKDELNRLKFFNKTKKDSLMARHSSLLLDGHQESFTKPSTKYEPSRNSEETEIDSLSYDELDRRDLDKTSVKKQRTEFSIEADVHTQKQQSKQLRFNEDVVNIPRDDNDSEEEISALQYDEGKRINMNTFEESDSTVPSTSRDFKRFWVGSKGKKKKKTLIPRKF